MVIFQAAVVSILLYGCTTWTLTKRLVEKLDGNYTGMLRAILNKSWRQHSQGTNYTATCLPLRKLSKLDEPDMQDELISDVFLWTPTYGQAKAGRPARTYIHISPSPSCSTDFSDLCQDAGICQSSSDVVCWNSEIH